MIDRRDLLILLGAAALAPRLVRAQAKPPVVIGLLYLGSRESEAHRLAAFKEALGALGWKVDSQVVFEERFADGRQDRLRPLAEALAAKKPAMMVTGNFVALLELVKAAPKIPIVLTGAGDPVTPGFVKSLARPGGMVTGVTGLTTDLSEKYLEFLLAAAPTVRRVGFLVYSHNPNLPRLMEAARGSAAQHSVQASMAELADSDQIEPAIARLAKEGAQALVVLPGALFRVERRRIAKLAVAQRWPMVGSSYDFAEGGALLSYGADPVAIYRRAAWYADRILKGAKPADLPVEQPSKFELVINLKTAKAIGIAIPPALLVRVDRVIE